MSVVGQAYKAKQLEGMLNNHFKTTAGVVARTTATAKGITVGVYYEGSEELQVRHGIPRQTTFLAADKRTPHELFIDAVGPADHWVDVHVQLDKDIQEGRA